MTTVPWTLQRTRFWATVINRFTRPRVGIAIAVVRGAGYMVDRFLPPQSTKGMGGKETSDRAPTASARPLSRAPIPVSPAGRGVARRGRAESSMDQRQVSYVYAFG